MRCSVCLLVGWISCVGVTAQDLPSILNPSDRSPEAETSDPAAVPESVQAIEESQTAFREKVNFPPEPPQSADALPAETRQVRLINEVDSAFITQIAVLEELEKTRTELESLGPPQEWKDVSSIGYIDAQEITLSQLDQLHAIDNQLRQNLDLAQQEIARADRNLDLARQAFNRSDANRLRATNSPSNTSPDLDDPAVELARTVDRETYILRKLQARLAALNRDLLSAKVDRFEPFLASFIDKVVIDEAAVEKQQTETEQKERDLDQSLMTVRETERQAENTLHSYKESLPANPTPLQSARTLALEDQLRAAQAEVSLNQTWIHHFNLKREFRQSRYRFFKGAMDREGMIADEESLKPRISRLESEEAFLENKLDQVEQELAQRRRQLDSSEDDREPFLKQAHDATYQRLQAIQQEIYSTRETLTQARTFLRELQTETHRVDVESLFIRAQHFIVSIWQYELFRLNENRFTIATLVWVSVTLLLSLTACWVVALGLGKLAFPRVGMTPGESVALQKLTFYIFFVFAVVIVFAVYGFPLSSITVASGILALAIGFGSQEIIKNFISGIILLIERPIHQGDVIEVKDRVLTVASIGARSTRMRDYDFTEKIVPNSYLIENIVTNRTLSDAGIRSSINVGVAYGTPTRKAADLLKEAAASVENVFDIPTPLIIFADFGDNALVFTVYFWCDVNSRLSTSSEVRHRIAEVLAENDITVAFPQRDVHLDAPRPLQIEWAHPPGSDK